MKAIEQYVHVVLFVFEVSSSVFNLAILGVKGLKMYLCTFAFVVCGSVVNKTFKSPNYPNNYPNKMDCVYHVPIPRGMAINISFSDFEVEFHSTCG